MDHDDMVMWMIDWYISYNIISVLLMMLPYIGGQQVKKKPGMQAPQQLLKQWADIKKQLEYKAKTINTKIPTIVTSDFYKICRLKQIPDFYSNYLLIALQKIPQPNMAEVLAGEVREIINHRSHYHKITDILEQRPTLIRNVEAQLEIVEGFQDMNVGKTIKQANRNKINELLKQATTLEDIKDVEKKSINQLADSIVKLRNNTVQILDSVKVWRDYLNNISSKKSKIKIMYPHSGFNCLLVSLYDQSSILGSFLSKEFSIAGQNNPFILIGKQAKKKNQFQVLFKDHLAKDQTKYDPLTQEILSEYPYRQDPAKKQREIQQQIKQKEEQKVKWLKQLKQRSKLQSKLQEQKPEVTDKKQTKQKSQKKQPKNLMDIESILLKHKQHRKKKQQKTAEKSAEEKQDQLKISSPKKNDASIMNIYGGTKQKHQSDNKIKQILNEKNRLEQELKQANKKNKQFQKLIKRIEKTQIPKSPVLPTTNLKNQRSQTKIQKEGQLKQQSGNKQQFQNKIEAVYKSRHARKINSMKDRNLDNSQVSVEDLLNDKRSLEKQLKEQMRQRKSLENAIKRSEQQMVKKLESNGVEKSKMEQRISLLESQVQQVNPYEAREEDKLQKSKASVVSAYMNQKQVDNTKVNDPVTNLFESKLIEEKQKRLSLQKSMKDLVKEREKLEKTLEKSQAVMAKEKEALDKKMEKYQQTIQKLKVEHNEFKIKKQSVDLIQRKKSESLRMYTTTPMKNQQEQKKDSSPKKQLTHIQSANYFKLPPEIKKANLRQKTIQEKEESNQITMKSSRNLNKVQIIQTKKTIQIIYESNRRSKKKKNQNPINGQKESVITVNNQQIEKIKKEKQSLMFQLQREQAKRQRQEKAQERKALKEETQAQRYKQIIERERERKAELQNKIKSLKRELYDQFEERLKTQKLKFQQEKRELVAMIQVQKGEKQLKQKYLNNQIKFLKEMQSNQNQLIKLLQLQKKNRLEKQKQLAAEIAKKEELLQIIELEQIKKGIQSEIRKELQNDDSEQENDHIDIEEKKDQLRQQIQQMNEQRNMELEQIDEQNQKLKALIARIKNQQSKVVQAIQENIKEDELQNQQMSRLKTENLSQGYYQSNELKLISNLKNEYNSDIEDNKTLNKSRLSQISNKIPQKASPQIIDLEQTERIFQSRLKNQEDHQIRMHNQFKRIRESPQYKQKEEVQNIIEMYLQNPHQYPTSKNREYSPEEKKQIEQEVLNKSKLAGDFQRQLMQLKQVQKFVPTEDDDIMTSHLLNLKRVYEEKQSSALKQELFPSIKHDQKYHDEELSFQTQQIPPKTIRDHVQLHAKKFPVKKDNSKNFLSINRMRVAMLEQNRREKEKQLIDDEAKKKAKAEVLKRVLRAKQDQKMQKLQMQIERKRKLVEELQNKDKEKKQKAEKKAKKKQGSKSKQNSQDENIKENTISSWNSNKRKNQASINDVNLTEGQKQDEKKQDQNIEQASENDQKQQEQQQKQQEQGQFQTENLEITNHHSSLDRQKKQLQSDIYRYQDEIRSFVSRDEKYDIYQQFVDSNEIESYIDNIISISSDEIKGLNNNKTIKKDIPTYTSLLILIAKDKVKQVEVGIGVFHKEFQDSLYVCDYILAHNMRNFLNLIFNFSRYMFKIDGFTNKIEFFFDLHKLEEEMSIIHFIQFEEKCKRMGEVYVKVGSDKTRKYALRRNMFEPSDKQFKSQGSGLEFDVSLEIHSDLIKQRGVGFKNTKNIEYFSTTALMSLYLKKNQEALATFRKKSEDDLKYRQLLLTTLMFQKKQISIKICEQRDLSIEQRIQIAKNLYQAFTIQDPAHTVQQIKMRIQNPLPAKTKRCTFQIEQEQINYIIAFPEEAVTKIQSSNSSLTGIFLNLLPKYKLFIIEAAQFLTMNKANPEINTFFYIKHFIKNIVDVGKEQHSRVFVPEVVLENEVFLKDLSESVKLGLFGREKVKFGWNNRFNNSIVFTPTHKDLVIKKPFIISIMSAVVERAIEGTPLFATLVQ